MKKAILIAVLLAVGYAFTSQAVVIHWAVTTPVSGATSAALVYVGTGGIPPTWDGASFSGGTQLGTAEVLPDSTVGAQATTHGTQTAGGYYVVLFNAAGQYALSTSWLSFDDKINGVGGSADAITFDSQYPAQGTFDPVFGSFVPEPSTAMLLCMGAAVAALRRRKRV